MTDLDSYVEEGSPRPAGRARCATCRDYANLEGDIASFFERKARGDVALPTYAVNGPSLWDYLRQHRGYRLSSSALVRHVAQCLGLDHTTGRPHGGRVREVPGSSG